MTETTMPEIEIVYLGKVVLSGGKEGLLLIPASEAEKHGELSRSHASPFDAKGSKMQVVGGVYKCQGVVDYKGTISTYRPSTAQFVRQLNGSHVIGWQAQHEAVKLVFRAKAREKSAATDAELKRLVLQLRWAYRQIAANQRQGFKVWLLDELDKR